MTATGQLFLRLSSPGTGLRLVLTDKGDPEVRAMMAIHYSQPKGFVGRQLIYRVEYDGIVYGAIAGGSATMHLPGRVIPAGATLDNVVNNTFFHLQKPEGGYPMRNFATEVVKAWRERVKHDWPDKYGDKVVLFETLVEPPRTGELYRRDGWREVGMTKGMTAKRVGGKEKGRFTSGMRVWDRENLRPKRVFVRKP